ncbi:MAG: 3'-5' exonuclease [Promethearchaeota archaeon]
MKVIAFDIETTGLNPYTDKIIAISYQEKSGVLKILKEWRSSEHEILMKFWVILSSIDETCIIQGFNILTFDIPFVIQRLIHNQIAETKEIYKLFYRKLLIIDLKQNLIPMNRWRFKGLTWDRVLSKTLNKRKTKSNQSIPDLYKSKKYDEIEDYIRSEFYFHETYSALRYKGSIILS